MGVVDLHFGGDPLSAALKGGSDAVPHFLSGRGARGVGPPPSNDSSLIANLSVSGQVPSVTSSHETNVTDWNAIYYLTHRGRDQLYKHFRLYLEQCIDRTSAVSGYQVFSSRDGKCIDPTAYRATTITATDKTR